MVATVSLGRQFHFVVLASSNILQVYLW